MAVLTYPALAIDTSMTHCAIAISMQADSAPITLSKHMPRGHAEALIPMIQELCHSVDIPLPAIESFVAVRGPGAFAGLRVGLATIRALALANNKPSYGVTGTQCLALMAADHNPDALPICVVIETKRSDYYVQNFDADGTEKDEAHCLSGDDITRDHSASLIVGDALPRLSEQYTPPPHSLAIDAIAMKYVFQALETTTHASANNTRPLYCRDADVSYPKLTITVETQ